MRTRIVFTRYASQRRPALRWSLVKCGSTSRLGLVAGRKKILDGAAEKFCELPGVLDSNGLVASSCDVADVRLRQAKRIRDSNLRDASQVDGSRDSVGARLGAERDELLLGKHRVLTIWRWAQRVKTIPREH